MDDKKKFSRGKGPKPGGGRPAGPKRDFKAGFAKKPGGPRKPQALREDRSAGQGERPKRDFKPRGDRAHSSGDGPKREYKPREFKPRDGGGERPYSKPEGASSDAETKPYKPRFERRDSPGGDGPKREFKPREFKQREFRPRESGEGDRPFRKGPREGGAGWEGPRKSFGSRGDNPSSGGGFKPRPRREETAVEDGERIAKRLARAGIASRRDAEDLIAAGRVKVNGRTLDSPAFNVMPNDVIHLDGTEIPPIERTRLFLFHKPAGVVTTNRDPEGRKTVFDVLPQDLPRLMTIGRLDINTEGLLLLTNDGGLSRVLELPATGWLRRYRVRVHGKVEEKALAGLREGVAVDGVFYGAVEASLDREQGSNAWLTIGLREGKNREVKNILGSLGLDVTRLIRISYGPFQLNDLPEGHVLEIKGRMLREQLGERLIEESGANFDAEIAKPFSNRPVRRVETRPEEPARPKFTRDGERGRIGEGGLIKKRKQREGSRDEALGKLTTARPDRPGFGDRGPKPERDFGAKDGRPQRGGKKEREQRPIEPPGQRRANVWMAPGSRPIGKGRAEADAAKAAEAKAARKAAYSKPAGAKPFGKPRNERRDGDGNGRKGPSGRGGNADRRR